MIVVKPAWIPRTLGNPVILKMKTLGIPAATSFRVVNTGTPRIIISGGGLKAAVQHANIYQVEIEPCLGIKSPCFFEDKFNDCLHLSNLTTSLAARSIAACTD